MSADSGAAARRRRVSIDARLLRSRSGTRRRVSRQQAIDGHPRHVVGPGCRKNSEIGEPGRAHVEHARDVDAEFSTPDARPPACLRPESVPYPSDLEAWFAPDNPVPKLAMLEPPPPPVLKKFDDARLGRVAAPGSAGMSMIEMPMGPRRQRRSSAESGRRSPVPKMRPPIIRTVVIDRDLRLRHQ